MTPLWWPTGWETLRALCTMWKVYVDNVCRYHSVCTAHEVPGGAWEVYGATRLKQHSDVFSSSYRVLQSNITVDRNKYTERTPWWKNKHSWRGTSFSAHDYIDNQPFWIFSNERGQNIFSNLLSVLKWNKKMNKQRLRDVRGLITCLNK